MEAAGDRSQAPGGEFHRGAHGAQLLGVAKAFFVDGFVDDGGAGGLGEQTASGCCQSVMNPGGWTPVSTSVAVRLQQRAGEPRQVVVGVSARTIAKILSHVPSSDHLRRSYTVFHLPKRAGRSRHGTRCAAGREQIAGQRASVTLTGALGHRAAFSERAASSDGSMASCHRILTTPQSRT